MLETYLRIKRFFDKAKDDHINEYAAECAYFTILSFIPFILFLVTLIQFTVVDKAVVFDALENVLPSTTQSFIFEIIDEIYSKSVGTISISILVALWSASRGFYSLCKGLGEIYKVKNYDSNFLMRIKGLIYTFVFIIMIVSILLLIVFGNRIHSFVSSKFFRFGQLTAFILRIRAIFSILVLFIFFCLVYRYVPNKKLSFRAQIPGAFLSAVLWVGASFVFSMYIDIFKGFSNTYGSLTSLILVMMWVYVCMYIILLGAEINTIFLEYRFKKLK